MCAHLGRGLDGRACQCRRIGKKAVCVAHLALAATPKKSAKEGKGEVDVPLKVLGVEVLPGSFLLADEDGLLLLPEPPSGVRSGG